MSSQEWSGCWIGWAYLGRERNFSGQHFWARGYYVSTVGIDEAVLRQYIQKQEEQDCRSDQLSMFG
jgi:putative transposase